MNLLLDGEWRLAYLPEDKDGPSPSLDSERLAGAPVISAQVPGNVELDLQRAGLLPEPFFGDNMRLLRPYEFCEWWYSRSFEMPEDAQGPFDLVFEGLDTLATVWVNGTEVGRAKNMLIAHRFDVTGALRLGASNRVDVRLGSVMQYARRQSYDASCTGAEGRDELLHVRKAPHTGGWDIMCRALSAGIWRPVRLVSRPADAIERIYYWTAHADATGAVLGVQFQFRTAVDVLDGFSVRFHGVCGDHTFDYEWPVEFISGQCRITVPGARLWWPKGYGDANLYTVTATLCKDGQAVAGRVDRIGLRLLELDRTEKAGPHWMPGPKNNGRYDEEPEADAHFLFRVNGVRIQVRGSNWVPLDAFHSRDGERVDAAIALCDDLGCNMLRCWGGNVYEDHRFFDLCDEKGMLVWQDFAFACGRYPQTEAFLNEVRAEAESVAETLRNHPSLAVWCGDNEIDTAYAWDGLSPEHNRITREVLPRVLHRIDPRRAYVPSSPYISPGMAADTPEQHLWGPRGYYKGPFYTHHSAHFIGEIGYHGCPNVSSIRRFIGGDHVWPWQDNAQWRAHDTYHWRHDAIDRDRIKLMANQIREVFGDVFETIGDFALASQIVQAEAKKFFIESARLRKWRTSGILWWNVLDGWPQFSDAIVDYYFGKKLAYHYIWRVQRPVCAIIGEAGSEKYRPFVVCNDTRDDVEVRYAVRDAHTQEGLAEGVCTVPAGQNIQAARLRAYAGDHRVYLMEWEAEGVRYGNHYLAGSPPFTLEQYRTWLNAIAVLPRAFVVETIAQ